MEKEQDGPDNFGETKLEKEKQEFLNIHMSLSIEEKSVVLKYSSLKEYEKVEGIIDDEELHYMLGGFYHQWQWIESKKTEWQRQARLQGLKDGWSAAHCRYGIKETQSNKKAFNKLAQDLTSPKEEEVGSE